MPYSYRGMPKSRDAIGPRRAKDLRLWRANLTVSQVNERGKHQLTGNWQDGLMAAALHRPIHLARFTGLGKRHRAPCLRRDYAPAGSPVWLLI